MKTFWNNLKYWQKGLVVGVLTLFPWASVYACIDCIGEDCLAKQTEEYWRFTVAALSAVIFGIAGYFVGKSKKSSVAKN